MDLGTGILLGAVGVMAANRLVLMLPGWHERRLLFWGIQLLNLAAACFMIVHGVPELRGLARYANWVIALLFMLHIVQNNSRYTAARKQALRRGEDARQADRERMVEALRRGEGKESQGQDEDG